MRKKVINQIQGKVKSSYSAIASEFDQTRKVPWREFNHFLKYIKHGGSVLDLGCGNGRLSEFLQQKEVKYLGFDNNSELLEKAKVNYPTSKFQLYDMLDANLPNNTFDNILCIAAFHHIPSKKMRKKVADSIHKSLKKDGILILTTWNLFQLKYIKEIITSIFSSLMHIGLKASWNDLWIKWGKYPIKRYYHNFMPNELLSYFPKNKWKIEDFYFTKRGDRVSFLRSFNILLIVRKIN